jgi:endonuclease III
MSAASRPKASDKQAILKKLFPLLKKQYKSSLPKYDLPILETLIHAICLEDASQEEAEAAQERLEEGFHDYNEMRVSSISELNKVFEGMESPELRSLRIRSVLHYVFEEHYEFEFEGLRRKTLELATKQLNKIRDLSPFVKNFTLQVALGSHLVPVDEVMLRPVKWLGLVELEATPEDASETLKPAVRKSEGPLFCHLIRSLAHDPKLADAFHLDSEAPEEEFDLSSAPARLKKLLEEGPAKKAGKKTAKSSPKKTSKSSGKQSQNKNGASAKSKKTSKKSNAASTR